MESAVFPTPNVETLSAETRIALIRDVYAAAFSETESFRDSDIGADLAYLFGAISNGEKVDWSTASGGERPPLAELLERALPAEHPVWGFVLR